MSKPRTTTTDRYTLKYEPGLDALRAIAILAVVMFHACASSDRPSWFRGGFLGVSVFFTLSGFLITSMLLREYDQDQSIDAGRFWSRRIKRLIPAQMVMLSAVVAATWLGWFQTHRGDAIAAAWSVTNWHIIHAGPDKLLQTAVGPLGPTWSLAIEEQFYVVLMIVVVAVLALTRRPAHWLGIVALAVIAGSITSQLMSGTWNPRAEFGLDTRASELAVGVGLAVVMHQGRIQLTQHGSRSLDIVAGAGVVAIVAGALTLTYDPPWLLRGGYTLVALVTAATIIGLIGGARSSHAFAAPPFAWFVWVGQLSYSWYLVHWPTFLLLSPERTGLNGPALIIVKVAASLVVAAALSYWIERPLRRRPATSSRVAVAAWAGTAAVLSAVAWLTLPT